MSYCYKAGVLVTNLLLFLLVLILTGCDRKQTLSASGSISDDTPMVPSDVRIGPHYIEMPIGKIFLIRNDKLYGAVKITKYWTGRNRNNQYASYESWYQDDGTGDFSNKNAKFRTEKASSTLYGIGRFSFNFGNEEIRCGVFRLWWWGKGMVYFFRRGEQFDDYGIELAPTKWTDIREVNVFDPRLKWYKYDKNRLRTDIPVNELW
jgi:hypothetical protein